MVVDCSTPAFSVCGWQNAGCLDQNRHIHPIKAATNCFCWVFSCSEKGQVLLWMNIAQFCHKRHRQAAGEGRNRMLSPWKGITCPWHRQGTYSGHLYIIFFLYIPQFLLKELRYSFIRHISALFPDKLQKDTLFLLRACLPFCGCAFFSFLAAYIFCSG